jgi:lipopolysaccharide/colanic/teichoic acid biosynthesis glycosyltransferase
MGLAQLPKLPRFLARRQYLAARYREALATLPLVLPAEAPPGEVHAWHLYVIRLADTAGIARDQFIQALTDRGIGTSVHYIPLHRQPYWRDRHGLRPEMFPHSDAVLAAIAVCIRLDSVGPVIFRQERVGLHGRRFSILKFRTMRPMAETEGPQITVGADARITRSGRVLRKYKLDELPQLVNVLRGDMSVVGPRPEVPRYVALYPASVRDVVLSVRPGITDPASVAFKDEADLLAEQVDPEAHYVKVLMPIKLAHCVEYVQNQSLLLDLAIVGRTLAAVFGVK